MPHWLHDVAAFALVLIAFRLRAPVKLFLLLTPGPWGRAERLLWRHCTRRQRLGLYTRHRIVVSGRGAIWRLSRAWWRPPACTHRWFPAEVSGSCAVSWGHWHAYCYDGPAYWMPRADVLLAMKCATEAYGTPTFGAVPY